MGLATLILFAALVCFKACIAQNDVLVNSTANPGYETTIWTERHVEGTAGADFFSLTPTASAAVISSNLLLTLEEFPVPATPAIVHSPSLLLVDLFKSINISRFRRVTNVSIPSLPSDATTPKLAIYKVEPAFDMLGLQPISISVSKPNATDNCTMSVWRTDNHLYTIEKRVSEGTACPDNSTGSGTTPHFCVVLQLTPAELGFLKFLEGGLLVCNGQLAGLSSSLISRELGRRHFLDLVPFRDRIAKLIIDNAPVTTPGNSAQAVTSTVLCVVFAAFVASGSAL